MFSLGDHKITTCGGHIVMMTMKSDDDNDDNDDDGEEPLLASAVSATAIFTLRCKSNLDHGIGSNAAWFPSSSPSSLDMAAMAAARSFAVHPGKVH